ncbi:MAG TPA: cytochrome C oxidase subunit IV family protein [Candidatus Limnocylindria bacterium]|jgi:cytochrome c oxidase subunit 4|nr:cytochrome C oxidase subunit IV family protein [Candidatus Limnocylindria bacterium]
MSNSSVSPSAGHGHDAHGHDVASHNKVYFVVFGALLFGTILTVAMYFVHFQSMAVTITIALFIASIKAFLVAGYFMHLLTEKKLVYSVLTITAIFFVALIGLTMWGTHDGPRGTVSKPLYQTQH